MANYSNLLATIATNIYTNGNNKVTAAMVKSAVDQMVASLGAGYQFMGVATPATTPGNTDVKQFYIASQPGTYTNFLDSGSNPLEVNGGEISLLKYDTAWSKEDAGMAGVFVAANESPNFYPGGLIAGYISSGIISSTTLFRTTPLKIEGGLSYKATFDALTFGSNDDIAECDADGNIVTIFDGVISGNTITFSRPTNTYVMLNVGAESSEGSFMVCRADAFPGSYVPYMKEIGEGYDFNDLMRGKLGPSGFLAGISRRQSINLYNMNDPLNRSGYYSQAVYYSNANFRVTHPIAVAAGVTYKAMYPSDSVGASNNRIPIVNAANDTILGYIFGTISGNTITFTPTTDCLVSVNVGKITDRNFDPAVFIVSTLADYPQDYVPFYDYFEIDRANATNGPVSSKLFGKSVIFTGDSICAADTDTPTKTGWAKRIGVDKGMSWANRAVGGGTLIDKSLVGSSFTISDTDFGSGADYIILEGGTNDADRIGSILGGATPALFGSYDMTDYTSNFTNDTFCGAVEMLLKKAVSTFPSAKVGFIIAPKMGVVNTGYTADTNNRRAYFEVIMTLCKKWGVPVLNLWDECTMNPRLASHYTSGQDYLYVDGQHPTHNGYDFITPIIQSWMETL